MHPLSGAASKAYYYCGGARGWGRKGFTTTQAKQACNVCEEHHPGEPPEDNCWHRDIDTERAKMDALEAKLTAGAERTKDRQEKSQHQNTQFVGNQTMKQHCCIPGTQLTLFLQNPTPLLPSKSNRHRNSCLEQQSGLCGCAEFSALSQAGMIISAWLI